MTTKMTPLEMFNDLVRRGYAVPATIEPSSLMMPTAYISVPTITAFSTPPITADMDKAQKKAKPDAKLAARTGRNTKGKKR